MFQLWKKYTGRKKTGQRNRQEERREVKLNREEERREVKLNREEERREVKQIDRKKEEKLN
jgi:hypothetical protein